MARRAPHSTVAITGVFFAFGLIMGNLAARFPDIKIGLGTEDGPFGWALLGATVGALVGAKPAGIVGSSFGSRLLTRVSLVTISVTVVLLAFASNVIMLFFAFVAFGIATAGITVGTNALAIDVERAAGRPIMVMVYAWSSIGAIVGSLAGSLASHLHTSIQWNLSILAILCAIAGLLATSRSLYPPEASLRREPEPKLPVSQRLAEIRSTAVLSLPLAVVAFCFYIAEASIDDWSGIYLRDALSAPLILTGAGYAAFQAGLLLGRLRGDRLVTRFGPARVVGWGCFVASSLFLGAMLVGNVFVILGAFLVYGIGLSVTSPICYRAAANVATGVSKERVLANVTLGGYVGLLVGPVLIGQVAQIAGIGVAMGIPAVLGLAVAVLAPVLRNGGFQAEAPQDAPDKLNTRAP